mmetsp:Transcript_10597/g.25850  ORF Transcript_10597/g.25850 Transcript_10597/m.25850 type:complete len:422 (+) Transcript_10597:87-1352(+)|eukprot:CAMPEP_0179000496 /NCGR_PEP_ID=MMETSP0795-20121207/10719_1 /TAXON_ID=88552 /ORGANISM="Amoebophrya sp., Strain Ameob2" /LENGTH=421 /DNA_ID=CAMNT_0020693529 /DNA_START=39 /DNA_END=1304 /DNA_ORIENTATION=+
MTVSSSPPLHQDQPNLIESAFLACASSPTRLQADDKEREGDLQLPLFRLKRALAFIVGETLVTDSLVLDVVLRFFADLKGVTLSEEDFYHVFGLADEYLTSTRPPSQERWREVAEAESGQRDPRKDAAVVHVGRDDWSRKPSKQKDTHTDERREESDKQLELRKPEVGSVFSPTAPPARRSSGSPSRRGRREKSAEREKEPQPLWNPSPGLWQPLWLEKERWFADRGRGTVSHSFAQTSLKKYNRAVDLHTEGVKDKEKEDQEQQKEEGAKARFLLSDRHGSPADANIVEKSSPAEDAEDANILDRLFSDHSTGFEHVGREKAEEGGRRRMLMGDLQRAMVELMGEEMATGQLVQELFRKLLVGRDHARNRGRARNRISAEEEAKTSASNAKNAGGGEGAGLTQRQFRKFFVAFEEITAGA